MLAALAHISSHHNISDVYVIASLPEHNFSGVNSPPCNLFAVPYAAVEDLQFRHNSAISVQFSVFCDVSLANQNCAIGFHLMCV
jgi:hypothetical protein